MPSLMLRPIRNVIQVFLQKLRTQTKPSPYAIFYFKDGWRIVQHNFFPLEQGETLSSGAKKHPLNTPGSGRLSKWTPGDQKAKVVVSCL